MSEKLPYQKIYPQLLADLNARQKEIVLRRFGLAGNEKETLETIGRDLKLTRERVRQIIEAALAKIRQSRQFSEAQKAFSSLEKYLALFGGLKREDLLFSELGGEPEAANAIGFLLVLGKKFARFGETKEFHSYWAVDEKRIAAELEKTVIGIKQNLEKMKKPATLKELARGKVSGRKLSFLKSTLEISKEILQTNEGKYGLRIWPEVNPRGVKDLALIVLRQVKKPLHFIEIASQIDDLQGQIRLKEFSVFSAGVSNARKTNYQTVHNELIKNPQFVLVGRGTYALKEWGYEKGTVREIISGVLKEARKPLSQQEILKKVLSQRLVKESTILLNLGDKKCFLKSSDGNYSLREA